MDDQVEFELSPLSDAEKSALPSALGGLERPQDIPSALFNGMIAPIVPYTAQGIVWYQGESNASRAFQYRKFFPALIQDWRQHWGSELPFYFCQLPNFSAKAKMPGDSQWAELREAQSMALSLPQTGQAVLIDLGEEGTIHPRNKKEVAERLACIALAKTYGKDVPCSGPVYDSMQVDGDKIRLKFLHIEGGLVAKPLPPDYQPTSLSEVRKPLIRNSPNSELEGFAVCGQDGKWGWADAKIDGSSVLVSSPSVPSPVAVRYAWANNPTCNLYNGAGFPAAPFRTDAFPLTTMKASF